MSADRLVPADIGNPMSYDLYCPSLRRDVVRRVCEGCLVYHSSMAAVQRHRRGRGCEGPAVIEAVDEVTEVADP